MFAPMLVLNHKNQFDLKRRCRNRQRNDGSSHSLAGVYRRGRDRRLPCIAVKEARAAGLGAVFGGLGFAESEEDQGPGAAAAFAPLINRENRCSRFRRLDRGSHGRGERAVVMLRGPGGEERSLGYALDDGGCVALLLDGCFAPSSA